MTKMMITIAAASLLLAAPPVAPAASATQKTGGDADMQAIASYRLTMPTVKKVAAAMQVFVAELQKDPRYARLAAMEQAIEKLEAKEESGGELTEAEANQLEELRQKKEALEDEEGDIGSGNSIAEMEASVRKEPALMKGLQSQGIAPREYATFMMAYIQAAMVYGMQKQGHLKEAPAGVNMENIKFMAEHEKELAEIQKQFEALDKKSGH